MPKHKSKGSNQPKQEHKNEEQLRKEAEQKREIVRQRAIVTDKLYPIVLKASKNVSDSMVFLQILSQSIRQQFNNQMLKQDLKDLNLLAQIDSKAERAAFFKEALELFQDEKVITATKLIEGLGDEIDRLIKKENAERSLSTLKTDFIPKDEAVQ